MKKLLLSLAVIAASGAYVAYENPFDAKAAANANAAADAAPPAVKPADAVVPASQDDTKIAATPVTVPAPIAPPAEASTGRNLPASAPTSAFSSLQFPATPQRGAVQVAEIAAGQASNPAAAVADVQSSPTVPLPRPRPADAPVVVEAAQAASTQAGYRDGSFKGSSANAYYGRVQVDAVIQGGQLVSVHVLDYPSDRNRSRYINSRALPELAQEAIQAQSANIDIVSGATLTSEAYIHSLDAALSAARTGGNNA